MTSGVVNFDQASGFHRFWRRVIATGPGALMLRRFAPWIDPRVLRLTRGKYTLAHLVSGLPVVWLTTTGARTGRQRTTPVLGFPVDEGLAVIASNFGQGHDPAWSHNLRAHPEGEVSVDGRGWRFRATEASGDQRARIWRQGLTIYPGWSAYERRAGNRRIPVFVLEAA